MMDTAYIELSPEQQSALQQIAKQSGEDISTIVSRAINRLLVDQRWIEEMRHAYLEGVASGDDGILDMEEIIKEAEDDWAKTHPS